MSSAILVCIMCLSSKYPYIPISAGQYQLLRESLWLLKSLQMDVLELQLKCGTWSMCKQESPCGSCPEEISILGLFLPQVNFLYFWMHIWCEALNVFFSLSFHISRWLWVISIDLSYSNQDILKSNYLFCLYIYLQNVCLPVCTTFPSFIYQ